MKGVGGGVSETDAFSTHRSYSPELAHHSTLKEHLEPLHVFDLPQLYRRPTAEDLLQALDLLAVAPPSFEAQSKRVTKPKREVVPEGITYYLTSIIASPLSWIKDGALQERIWESAAERLSERSGRTAMPSMTRMFEFETPSGRDISISIHEPSLTADNLGLKTWTSSYQLSKRLAMHKMAMPISVRNSSILHALELGAGTGLVGLAFASTYKLGNTTIEDGDQLHIHMTDLPSILPNLEHNVSANKSLMPSNTTITTGVLDWSLPALADHSAKYDLILAADPVYTPSHPPMLASTIISHLKHGKTSRVFLEMPLREGFSEVHTLRTLLQQAGLRVQDEGEEIGFDDWGNGNARDEVLCWWSVWAWEHGMCKPGGSIA